MVVLGAPDRRHRGRDVPADLQARPGGLTVGREIRRTVLLLAWLLAVLGLCIGSFLNVVIHRLPLMLERGWKEESAEMLGVALDAPPPSHAVEAALALPVVRPRDRLAREHPQND